MLVLNSNFPTNSCYHLRITIGTDPCLSAFPIWLHAHDRTSSSVSLLSITLHATASRHIRFSKRSCLYVAGTKQFGPYFPSSTLITKHSLVVADDADWSGCENSRRSATGYIFCINGTPIFCQSNRQRIGKLSTVEVEYVPFAACGEDIFWLHHLVYKVSNRTVCNDVVNILMTFIEVDISAATSMASVSFFTKLRKHIGIRFHDITLPIWGESVSTKHVSNTNQITDCLTKVLTGFSLAWMVNCLKLNFNAKFGAEI